MRVFKGSPFVCVLLCGLSALGSAAASDVKDVTVLYVGRVTADTIGVTVQDGKVEYGRQIPYTAEPGDVVAKEEQHRTVRRNGAFLGWLVGKEKRLVYTADEVVGKPTDVAWMDKAASYTLVSDDDPAYAQETVPAGVFRKTKPSDFARVNGWPYHAPLRHVLYLKGPQPFKEGKHYRIRFAHGVLPEQAFACDSTGLCSEAVRNK